MRTHGNYTIKRQSVAAAHRRVRSWLSELAHATRKINNGRLWLYQQLLMLDGPGTGVDDPVFFGALRVRTKI